MKIRDAILKLGTYKPPLEGRNPKDYLLMDFNESPVPPPTHVVEALVSFFQEGRLQVYPSYGDFLELLSEYVGVSPDHLILTNGSDQAIDIALRAVLDESDEMLMAKPGFSMFFQVAGTLGARSVSPVYRADMSFPFEKMMNAVTPQTRLIVVVNPNNPTGTSASLEQLQAMLRQFPDIAVLVDEAYYEFTGETCVPLLAEYPNLIITRTFSKAFAIPSLRLGYVVANPELIGHLYKIRGPYDVNMVALIAARAQLEHPEIWQRQIQEIMSVSKPLALKFFEEYDVRFYSGEAHFMLVEPKNVEHAIHFLKDRGVLVRPMRPPVEHTFRISLGTPRQTEQFIRIYKDYLQEPG